MKLVLCTVSDAGARLSRLISDIVTSPGTTKTSTRQHTTRAHVTIRYEHCSDLAMRQKKYFLQDLTNGWRIDALEINS